MTPLYGGIEGGGTKFVCVVGSGPGDIRAETRFPTTTPAETLGQAIDFFRQQQAVHGRLAAIGLACFGPLDPDPGLADLRPHPADAQARLDRRGCGRAAGRGLWRAGGLRYRRQRRGAGGGALGRRPGLRPGALPDHRHRHRRRGAGQRQAAARADPPGDGAHLHPARPPARSLPRVVPLPRRLLRGAG